MVEGRRDRSRGRWREYCLVALREPAQPVPAACPGWICDRDSRWMAWQPVGARPVRYLPAPQARSMQFDRWTLRHRRSTVLYLTMQSEAILFCLPPYDSFQVYTPCIQMSVY